MVDSGTLLLVSIICSTSFVLGCYLIGRPLTRIAEQLGRIGALPLVLLTGREIQAQVTPADHVRAARADAARLPRGVAQRTRYISAYHTLNLGADGVKEYNDWRVLVVSWPLHITRETGSLPPREVVKGLWAIDLAEYSWSREVWDNFEQAQAPYFYTPAVEIVAPIKVVPKVVQPQQLPTNGTSQRIPIDGHEGVFWWTGGKDRNGVDFSPGFFRLNPDRSAIRCADPRKAEVKDKDDGKKDDKNQKKQLVYGEWIDPIEAKALEGYTGTKVPIVRADWWFFWVGGTKAREGAGYYEFLGLIPGKSKEADALALGDVDFKGSEKVRALYRGIVSISGVARGNRAIEAGTARTQYPDGTAGVGLLTRDYLESTAKKNAVRLLEGDAPEDAGEGFITLPNGAFATWAQNAQRVIADEVDPHVAPLPNAPDKDGIIEAGFKCFDCHKNGLQPVDDWGREVYQPPFGLGGRSVEDTKRLRSAYVINDLPAFITRGQKGYGVFLQRAVKLTPQAHSEMMNRRWYGYTASVRTLNTASADWGYDQKDVRAALEEEAKTKGVEFDPIFAGLLSAKAKTRRDQLEEVTPLAHRVVRGYLERKRNP